MKLLFIGLLLVGAAFAQPESYLAAGQLEVRGLFGAFGASRLSPHPAYGGELAYALKDWFALTGAYIYNSLLSVSSDSCTNGVCAHAAGKAGIKEMTAGVRFTMPGRIAAYGAASAGKVSLASSIAASSGPFSFSSSAAIPYMAVEGGGGVDFSLSRSWGLAVDARVVKANGLTPYVRLAGGVYFRFQ